MPLPFCGAWSPKHFKVAGCVMLVLVLLGNVYYLDFTNAFLLRWRIYDTPQPNNSSLSSALPTFSQDQSSQDQPFQDTSSQEISSQFFPSPSPSPSIPSSSLFSHCYGMKIEGVAHCLFQNSACLFNNTLYINATYNASLFPRDYIVAQARDFGHHIPLVYLPNHNITTAPTFIPNISIFYWNVHTWHYGHTIVENMYAWVQLLGFFNLTNTSVGQYNLFGHDHVDPTYIELFMSKPDNITNENETMCFETLLVGIDQLSLLSSKGKSIFDIHPTAHDVPLNGGQVFRDYISRHLHLSSTREREPVEVYIVRRNTTFRMWHKADEVVPKLSDALLKLFSNQTQVPKYRIHEVDFVTMSLVEQIRFLRNNISVLVGISGTGLHNAMFLSARTALIEVVPAYYSFINYQLCKRDADLYCQAFEAPLVYDPPTQKYGAFNESLTVEIVVDIDTLALHVQKAILYAAGKFNPPPNVIDGFREI